VLSKAPVPPGTEIDHWYFAVRIRVVESFRGTQKVGDIVKVQTGMGGGDCGFPFEVGKQYLVDAWDRSGTVFTGICSHTASVDRGQADIRVLRKIASHQRLPELAGELSPMSDPEGGAIHPLGGVSVPEGPVQIVSYLLRLGRSIRLLGAQSTHAITALKIAANRTHIGLIPIGSA
jgi:hypothetical protein